MKYLAYLIAFVLLIAASACLFGAGETLAAAVMLYGALCLEEPDAAA